MFVMIYIVWGPYPFDRMLENLTRYEVIVLKKIVTLPLLKLVEYRS